MQKETADWVGTILILVFIVIIAGFWICFVNYLGSGSFSL